MTNFWVDDQDAQRDVLTVPKRATARLPLLQSSVPFCFHDLCFSFVSHSSPRASLSCKYAIKRVENNHPRFAIDPTRALRQRFSINRDYISRWDNKRNKQLRRTRQKMSKRIRLLHKIFQPRLRIHGRRRAVLLFLFVLAQFLAFLEGFLF